MKHTTYENLNLKPNKRVKLREKADKVEFFLFSHLIVTLMHSHIDILSRIICSTQLDCMQAIINDEIIEKKKNKIGILY